MIDERFIILAVVIDVVGSWAYIADTLKGKTKPNKVTWFLWTVIPMIALVGMLDEKAETTSLILTFTFGFLPLLIFIASFVNKKSFWKITMFDWVCGTLSVIGIAAWLVTSNGNLTIFFVLIANFLSLLPTLVKTLRYPETETWITYFNATLAALIALLTIKTWTFASVALPMYFFITAMIMFLVARFKIGPRLLSLRHEGNEV